ncbi:hypothetical protein EW145_g8210 [Phellinidium pouzarii]|uniref:Uncharacterized protein n=1 Tax=Phellinidium pouzarii TaxID=167371 RepID=A0A4S4KA36_9AGAM|nr:hypothetical protein EW145_g8210 [Phellinidium pouzarii]
MSASLLRLLLFIAVLALLPSVRAFGAGSIPAYAYLHDRAFRHGDIESILSSLAKSPHHHTGGSGGLADFFSTLARTGLAAVLRGSAAQTFSKTDGNWLRDYSQAIDVAGLSKMTHDTLLILVQALGFMSFGFATREFRITPDRLGVYLPVEHIDNPKGYADAEGDARRLDPRLRPPVDPRELDIDPRNGMKMYMATEDAHWDTSTAHVRRTLCACIELGRQVHGKTKTGPRDNLRSRFGGRDDDGEGQDDEHADDGGDGHADGEDCEEMWEAFRLLGTALHTLEDLLAHIYYTLTDTPMRTPSHLSQASIIDLTAHMEEAESSTSAFTSLRELLARLPSALNPSQRADAASELKARAQGHRASSEMPRTDDARVDLAEYVPLSRDAGVSVGRPRVARRDYHGFA